MSSLPTAVLWDMDGTLVDTEPYWFDAEHRLVNERGNGQWSTELAERIIGADLLDAARFLREHGEVDIEPQPLVELLIDQVVARLGAEVPWRPGARELLMATVAAGVPCALVTMSWRRLADPVIAHLPGAFAASVTGDEVPAGEGKPHPTPYRLGAESLGVNPHDCVAIEDSPTGVRSALAAGCTVLGIPNDHLTLTAADGLTRRESLVGMTPFDLGALAAGQ